jgi:hypothetical protein
MGVVTWDGSASTDYGTAANWDSGVVPSASSNVVIPDTSSINNCVLDQSRTANSFMIEANGTFDGDGNTLTIDSEGDATTGNLEGYAVRIYGIISGSDTDIQITTPAATSADLTPSSGTIRNLTINHASAVVELASADCVLSGNLTITAGELNTRASSPLALTVAGYTHVGDGSAAADTSTLTLNGSTCSFGTGKTDAEALWIKRGGTLVGGSGNWTAGSVVADNHANCKFTLTSGTITVNGHSADDTRPLILGGTSTHTAAHGGGTIVITYGSGAYNLSNYATTSLNNLTLNSNVTATISSPSIVMAGKLEISQGTLDTDSSNNRALTVTGTIDVDGGNLTINDSAVSCAKLIVESGDTITASHSSNALTVTGAGIGNNRSIDFTGAISGTLDIITTHTGTREDDLSASSGTVNHLTVNHADAVMRMNAAYTVGNLTITAGQFSTADAGGSSKALTVTGEMHSQGTFTGNSSTVTVRNLLIEGGTFNAPDGSGMLNITGEGNSGLGDGYAFRRVSGAFVDNTGTVTFKTPTTTTIRMGTAGQDFYNVIIDESSAGGLFYVNDEGFTVTNDLTLTDGDFDTGLGTTAPLIDIQGDLTIGANNTFGGITATQTGNISFGSIVIGGTGATYKATSGTTTITSENTSNQAWWNERGDNGFVHNNGKVVIDTAGNNHTTVKENKFYDLEVNMTSNTREAKFRPCSGTHSEILNNFTLTSGIYEMHADGDTLDIHGLTTIEADGQFLKDAEHTGLVTHHGLVTNRGNYMLKDGVTVKMNGGIRQLGTFTTP